jgi:hypothetical protein
MAFLPRPFERAVDRLANLWRVERRSYGRGYERRKRGAFCRDDVLRQPKLLKQAARRAGADPGGEGELQPARQPGIDVHAGGGTPWKRERRISAAGASGRLKDIR